jgi:hypothetical protein
MSNTMSMKALTDILCLHIGHSLTVSRSESIICLTCNVILVEKYEKAE